MNILKTYKIKSKTFKYPFRVGKKQKLAVLDAEGLEVVIFPKGCENLAQEYCDFKNKQHQKWLNHIITN